MLNSVKWDAGPVGPDGRRSGGNESVINRFVTGNVLCWSSDGHPCIDVRGRLVRMEPGDWVAKFSPDNFRVFRKTVGDEVCEVS